MRTKVRILIPSLIFMLLLFGCEQKKKGIEIVPNLDAIYLTANEVDTPANGGKGFNNRMVKDLTDAVKSLNYSAPGLTVVFPFSLRLYINENGRIDKIKDITPIKTKAKTPDSVRIYPYREKLDKAIASKLSGWKFEPAKKDGENVKYRTDFSLTIIKTSTGNYQHSPLFSLDNLPGKENTFFVAVEQMPEPIGGIKAIQEKIKYPEEAKKEGIEGKVYILAFIDEKGNVVHTKILKGIGGGCDEAAVKAVEETKFTPGRQHGKAVKTQVSIPIAFTLK